MKKLIISNLAVILFAAQNVCFSQGFRKHPYLQNVKQHEITICWKIQQAADTNDLNLYRVEYGIGDYSNIIPYPATYPTDVRLFQLPLTGLQPATFYQYRVKSGSRWSNEATFFTAVESNQPFGFVVYGDTQPKTGDPINNHEDIVNLISPYSPDFIVHCGDMWFTNKGSNVELFFDITAELMKNTSVFPALGNHEYWTNASPGPGTYTDPERYKRYFVVPTKLSSDEDYYSFDYGNSHFIIANANLSEGGPDYRLGSAQYTAIENDLINAANDPNIAHIFAVVHKPAHSNGWKHGCGHGSVIEDPNISVDLGQLFQAYNVDIVFSGHDHNYQRFQPVDTNHEQIWICDPPGNPHNPDHPCNTIRHGVTYVVTGGGGYGLTDVDPAGSIEDCPAPQPDCYLPAPPLTSIAAEKTFHAIFVAVDGEEVYVEVKDTNDSIIDQFTIVKEAPPINLITPDDSAVLPDSPPATFRWQADNPNQFKFKIEFSPTSSFAKTSTITFPRKRWIPDTSTDTIPARKWQKTWNKVRRTEDNSGIIYWRIIGKSGPSAPIDISEIRSFTIAPCPQFDAGFSTGAIGFNDVTEASGLEASWKNPYVLWTHNDSGDSARVFAMNTQGTHLGIYNLSGASNRDWEDMAIGPGPVNEVDYLYLGDIGDNGAVRSAIKVYRVPEPEVDADQSPVDLILTGVDTITLQYPDGARDAETLMLDPVTKDIYIISKRDEYPRVYRAAYPQSTSQTITMEYKCELPWQSKTVRDWVTAGDISPNGSEIIVRSYDSASIWQRPADANFWDAFAQPECPVQLLTVSERRGEAICFVSGFAYGYMTIGEGEHSPIFYFPRISGADLDENWRLDPPDK